MILAAALFLQLAGPFDGQREAMVRDQIEARGIRNPAVLRAMRATPRHRFVPESGQNQAYEDHPLPIGDGQTISQPYIVALMTELLDLKPSHKVLEVGTGSGYQAAILSQLAGRVHSIELVPSLSRRAAALLAELGYRNVTVRTGDGYAGWPEHAPFDRIILTAAPPKIPEALIAQLGPSGILVAPEGTAGNQMLIVLHKRPDGSVRRRIVTPVRFVPMVPGR